MKILIALLVSLSFTLTAHAFEWQQDKIKHLAATTVISATTVGIMRSQGHSKFTSFMVGILAANAVGYMKELSDKNIDQDDLKANALGSLLGASIVISF